jgi:hypothetical protein
MGAECHSTVRLASDVLSIAPFHAHRTTSRLRPVLNGRPTITWGAALAAAALLGCGCGGGSSAVTSPSAVPSREPRQSVLDDSKSKSERPASQAPPPKREERSASLGSGATSQTRAQEPSAPSAQLKQQQPANDSPCALDSESRPCLDKQESRQPGPSKERQVHGDERADESQRCDGSCGQLAEHP